MSDTEGPGHPPPAYYLGKAEFEKGVQVVAVRQSLQAIVLAWHDLHVHGSDPSVCPARGGKEGGREGRKENRWRQTRRRTRA